MKAALALVVLLAAPSWSLFGREANKLTVLWVPSDSFSDWAQLDGLLERYKDLRFTAAVNPAAVPPDAAQKLAAWQAAGRLELALRLDGDPILPLVADHPDAPRPQDALDRLALSRDRFKALFGIPPIGFVPGGGALSPALLDSTRAMAFSWAAAGDFAGSSTTWAGVGTTVLVPFKAAQTFGRDLAPADLSLPDYPRPDAFVVDEADGLVPEGSWLRLLRLFAEKHPKPEWSTVGETAARRRASGLCDAFAIKAWPTWAGGTALWTSGGAGRAAWRAYGQTARALEHYQNSGSADLRTLEDATAELYKAQSSRYYRLLGQPDTPEAAAADRELRRHLAAVFRKTRQTPPESLYVSLLSAAGGPAAGDDEPVSTDVHFAQGGSWLAFENPPGSVARAPQGAAPLADGTAAGELWRIKSLRVEWDGSGTTFTYKMARLDPDLRSGQPPDARAGASGSNAPELGSLILDTYVDLNHIAGAGSTQLLPGRPGAVAARDAWEYALTISGWGAFLYRANPLGSPLQVGRLAVTADARTGEVRVAVPSALLRGNPLRWGYVVLSLAADPAPVKAGAAAKPLVEPSRGAALGALAPLEQQMALSADGGRPRLAALRAKSL